VVGRPTLRSVDSECESLAIEPRNPLGRGSPCRPNSWGRVESPVRARGIWSHRGPRTRQTHTRVPQEPGRPVHLHREIGSEVPNQNFQAPGWASRAEGSETLEAASGTVGQRKQARWEGWAGVGASSQYRRSRGTHLGGTLWREGGRRVIEPLEGNMAEASNSGTVFTQRQRIAELAHLQNWSNAECMRGHSVFRSAANR